MTREEEIKQAAYSRYAIVSSPVVFKAQCNCFIEGAKWADNTMIEKACEWLKEYGGVYWMDDYDLPTDELVNDFKKAMKGEEE